MKNHNSEALQLKSLTGQVQGVSEPPNNPQRKSFFTQNNCCEHTPVTASASGTWVRAATAAGLNEWSHQHQLKNQAAVLPAHQVPVRECVGFLTSNHKSGSFPPISSQLLTGRRMADFGLQRLSERKILEHRLFTVLFLTSHLWLETQPSDIQTASMRRDPAKEEEIQWTRAQLPHPLTIMHSCSAALQSNMESGYSWPENSWKGLFNPASQTTFRPQPLSAKQWAIPAMNHPCGSSDLWLSNPSKIYLVVLYSDFSMFPTSPLPLNKTSIYQSSKKCL